MQILPYMLLSIAFLFVLFIRVTLSYNVGVGRADVTGPSVEITFMGYANLRQRGHGIHLRQFSRTFVVEDEETWKRIVFVSVDSAMISHAIKRDVIRRLKDSYEHMYENDNIAISGTHTHSGPGGFLTYLMYDLSCLGYVSSTYSALVDGIYESIVNAHNAMKQAKIFFDETEVLDANINRSPTAYNNNHEEERAAYRYNVDKRLVQLRFVDKNNEIFGAFNWFAVHPVSMNNTNQFISSDNVGYASILLETEYNPNNLIGTGTFVGAFASTNLGDVSPNIMGPKCEYTGDDCDILTSSCPEGDGQCFASGPGKDMVESTKIIGSRIFNGASELLKKKAGIEVKGSIGYILQNMDMTDQRGVVNSSLGNIAYQGCYPAMGYSFAAGTTDGPGVFDFEQGTTTENPLWDIVRDFIAEPTEEDKSCQYPKPILLAAGRAVLPYEWIPRIVPVQVLRIGSIFIAAIPGELTTMSGRRLRNTIAEVVYNKTGSKVEVIAAGLSNLYTNYIATPEEYEIQRYEGASTIYGKHTLTIYLNKYRELTEALLTGQRLDPGPEEPNLDDKQIGLNPPVIFDGKPNGKDFGDVVTEPHEYYHHNDDVEVKFVSGNPRTDIMRGKSFFQVQKKQENGEWQTVANDANWETRFEWKRTNIVFAYSEITFHWMISNNIPSGIYRIIHDGHYQTLLNGKFPYTGITREFNILE